MEYAHQNLVVHRDLKPGNVLVTGEGTPKLLDFGIAKLLDAKGAATPGAGATATGIRMLTPEYASPEQVRGEPVTTGADVYALGVLLYRLLTGGSPYRLHTDLAHELAAAICEQEPSLPSVMAVHARRHLAGDLDTIVLKALQKDPARRYASVAQFSEDIRRHLGGLPVIARKDTLAYRARKFVSRHKVGVAAAAAILLTLVGGVAATAWQARRAEAQRALAERRFADARRLANAFIVDVDAGIEKLTSRGPRGTATHDAEPGGKTSHDRAGSDGGRYSGLGAARTSGLVTVRTPSFRPAGRKQEDPVAVGRRSGRAAPRSWSRIRLP